MKLRLLALVVSGLVTFSTAQAGLIIVSGDENITNALAGNSTAVNTGNQTFFTNILGGGTQVRVYGNNPGGIDQPGTFANAFYNTLPGVTSSILGGPVTGASLTGVDLFVGAIPNAFTAPEITALSAFSAGGGTIFLMGDGVPFAATWNANINNLLIGLGSALRIVDAGYQPGAVFQTATGGQIVANPLTSGVTSLSYTYVSEVTGGTALFKEIGGRTFIAVEGSRTTTVPDSGTSVLLLGLSLALVSLVRRQLG